MGAAPPHHDGRHHAHEHVEGSPGPRRSDLPPGAGRGQCLFLDCSSGIAGDMTLAALVDLGVPFAEIRQALELLPVDGYELELGHSHQHGIRASTFDVRIPQGSTEERSFADIDAMLARCALPAEPQRMARQVFRRLAEAEASVHGTTPAHVTFHEVGAVDSIVDIVGAAVAIAYLAADVVASPVPIGRGFVSSRHGVLPLPAPAALHCLQGIPTFDAAVDGELVTPTGAALLAALATRFEGWPAFTPERIGYGAGSHTLPDRPNVLRAVLGRPTESHRSPEWAQLEANVDDLTGELAGHAIGALLAAGAVDAWASPIVMKKGRPALTLAALAPPDRADDVARALLRETSTIGVRRTPVRRTVRPREQLEVATSFGPIIVKVSTGLGVPAQVKPEFDSCAEAAQRHGVPVRVVLDEALAAYRAGRTGQRD